MIVPLYSLHIFYKQLHFQSQPGVASEILESEAKSCLAVAYLNRINLHEIMRNGCFLGKSLDFGKSQAGHLLNFWAKSQAKR